MFTTNPFAPLTAFVSPDAMQGYIVLMVLAVIAGTLFDLLHDRKLSFFLQERRSSIAVILQPTWDRISTFDTEPRISITGSESSAIFQTFGQNDVPRA